ncbi:hypothetical protein PHSY_004319 [Pseudozyma hubeiensis SY62]|uniref:Uncharacterized protein n=1 Tax=Pseudozyma hubeiensis (strain SY62) TaxID=1305764 RepID=R9PF71_PSEHS|nr:hypothetical protein PHSY_004319 [Pseudozyma hubeiensis SY62]GAC96735.1 hypothetical protein PHSY_004319 [Pseudozyma hubeiensis SY62]
MNTNRARVSCPPVKSSKRDEVASRYRRLERFLRRLILVQGRTMSNVVRFKLRLGYAFKFGLAQSASKLRATAFAEAATCKGFDRRGKNRQPQSPFYTVVRIRSAGPAAAAAAAATAAFYASYCRSARNPSVPRSLVKAHTPLSVYCSQSCVLPSSISVAAPARWNTSPADLVTKR